jgi:DNA-binding NarL/FixJ family response regulator
MNDRAQRVGGTLAIESAPGQGVRIVLEYGPELPERRVSAQSIRSASPPKKAAKILVVDDHRLFRDGLCQLLVAEGYTIAGTAASGQEAVDRIEQTRPNLVLMDVQMPDMDGLMAARTIKAQWPGIKILILTASASVSYLHDAVKAGASGFALKSIEAAALVALIDGALSGEVFLSAEVASHILKDFPPPNDGLASQPFDLLSSRQLEVLQWVAAGLTYKEIGSKLFISERTVKFHMAEIVEKLQVKDRVEATKLLKSRHH